MRTDPRPELASERDDRPPADQTDDPFAPPTPDTALEVPLAPPDGMRVITAESAVPYESPRVELAGPSFARALWRVASADVSSGNRVTLLRDGPRTFDCMESLIENARDRKSTRLNSSH